MYYDRSRNNNNYRRNNRSDDNNRQNNLRQQQRIVVNNNNIGVGNRTFANNNRSPAKDLPLRMVVNAKYVGAIIGQGGANIRQITKESKARCVVDVSRGIRDPTGILEKVINIYGPGENCSKACAKICEIVHREAQNDPINQGKNIDPELKLKAHNNLVGRLIGKGGITIKKIMDETNCTVFVSNTTINTNNNNNNAPSVKLSAMPVVCYSPVIMPQNVGGECCCPPQPQPQPPPQQQVAAAIAVDMSAVSSPQPLFIAPFSLPPPAPEPCMFVPANSYNNQTTSVAAQQRQSSAKKRFFNRSISELNAFNMERTITVRGSMSNLTQAEQKISAKLRQCWENDMLNAPYSRYAPHPFMNMPPPFDAIEQQQYPAVGRHMSSQQRPLPPTMTPSTAGSYIPQSHLQIQQPPNVRSGSAVYHNKGTSSMLVQPQLHLGAAATAGPPPRPLPLMPSAPASRMGPSEVVHVWVPNNMVGALIGTKGVHIRNVMRLTGAHIRIEAGRNEVGGGEPADQQQQESSSNRPSVAERRAQFWIFQRACEQGYRFFDEVRLCTEVQVPSRMVGRIIGKGGQNVRELQRVTGAQVKIPEDAVNPENDQTTVQVIGNFNAAQAVQNRVRHLIHQLLMQQNRTPNHHASGDHQQQQLQYNARPHYHQDYRSTGGGGPTVMVNHNDIGLGD